MHVQNNYYQAITNMKLQVVQKDNKYYGELPIKQSSLTVNSTYIGTVDINTVVRYGKVCRVEFRGKVTTAIPNNTTFLRLPYAPVTQLTIMAGIGGQYNILSPRWMYSTYDGEIRDGAIDKDNYIHISFTYICR